VGSIYLEGI